MPTLRRRPAAASAALVATLALLAGGCGGSDDDTGDGTADGTATSATPSLSPSSGSASGSPTASASSPSAPSSPAAGACTPPSTDVTYTAGGATLDVTAGPGVGRYELVLDAAGTRKNGYSAEDRELIAVFVDGAGHQLMIDIEGADPCQPDAFVSITINPDQIFVDPSHTVCDVTLTELSQAGASGTYACEGMGGGGEGVTIDAQGVFTVGEHRS